MIPLAIPKTICCKDKTKIEVSSPLIKDSVIIVNKKAKGSLLPLSISRIGARPCFKFNFFIRKILKTLAASVDAKTDPINSDSSQEKGNNR